MIKIDNDEQQFLNLMKTDDKFANQARDYFAFVKTYDFSQNNML